MFLQERTKNAQFIIISLRSNMFELSDYLIGIYKVKDCTETVCIRNAPPEIEGKEREDQSVFGEQSMVADESVLTTPLTTTINEQTITQSTDTERSVTFV